MARSSKAKSAVVTVEAPAERIAGRLAERARASLGEDPLGDDLLTRTFFGGDARGLSDLGAAAEPPARKPKPTHYKVISISFYQEDLERLEALVAELKRRGHTKASKSQLLRFALYTVNLDAMPRGY